MSSLLSKTFEALKIGIPPSQQTVASTRRPFRLDHPERQPQAHVQYYGFAVSRDWLVQFAEQHYPEALPDRNAKNYESTARTRAYELIRGWAGIYSLARKHCFNPKGGSVPPEWIAVYDGVYDNELDDDELMSIPIETVQVLTVCSDQDESFDWRPTQEKMDFITKLIGHAPRWWVSCGVAD